MARPMKRAERAWICKSGAAQVTIDIGSNVTAFTEVLCAFDEIEDDATNILKAERTEWYFERMILWFMMLVVPDGPFSTGFGALRLGQVDDDIDLVGAAFPGDLNLWGRVYQEDLVAVYPNQQLGLDNNSQLVVNTGFEGTPNLGYPVPLLRHKWDINVKSRVREAASIVLHGGPTLGNVAQNDLWFCEWGWKALLRRGR